MNGKYEHGKYVSQIMWSVSSRPEVFCKKGLLRNFANSQENTCARDSFLIKLQARGLRETLAQVFS